MDEKDTLKYNARPTLRTPYIVCGWNSVLNAGLVPVGGVNYLIKHFKAVKFAEMQTSHYHVDYVSGTESLRPVIKTDDGLIVETRFSKDEFYYALNPASDHDLIFFMGIEPNLNWEEYADTVVALAHDLRATRLYTFTSILDSSPYTREPRITCTCTSAKLKEEMTKYSVGFSSREGAPSINQLLVYACQKQGLDAVNMTVRVPYYSEFNVVFQYSPRSIKAVLVRLNDLMHLRLNFEELDVAVKEIQEKLDQGREQNAKFNTYIEDLEKDYEEMAYQEALDISANEAIRLAEEFLKRNKDQPQGK